LNSILVASFIAVTEALGTEEPVASVTVPTIDPVVVWAAKGSDPVRKHKAMVRTRLVAIPLIVFSLFVRLIFGMQG
jgi:hypothetical protein